MVDYFDRFCADDDEAAGLRAMQRRGEKNLPTEEQVEAARMWCERFCEMAITVTAKCVCCGATREIAAGEVPKGDVPYCEQCGCPMVAVEVR